MYNSHAKDLLNTSGRPNCIISTYKLEHPVLKSTEPYSDDNIKLRPRNYCENKVEKALICTKKYLTLALKFSFKKNL